MNTRIQAWGDRGLLVTVHEDSIEAANLGVHALRAAIEARRPAWLQDLVPAYASLGLVVDDDPTGGHAVTLDAARAWLEAQLASAPCAQLATEGRHVEIPVCYAPEFGPDLGDWAAAGGGRGKVKMIFRKAQQAEEDRDVVLGALQKNVKSLQGDVSDVKEALKKLTGMVQVLLDR